jgi:tetratricopeptide (TPR) repeat protein
MLFVRGARCFLHDFHHFLPRAAARWQSSLIALLLLGLPIVFRLGVAPALLALFLAVTFYLSRRERVVGAMLIGVLGLLPLAGELLARQTSFAGTSAEDVYLIERGGTGADEAATAVTRRAGEDKAGYAELVALGRHDLRRGAVDPAIEHLKGAVGQRNNDPIAMINLGNAMVAKGDLEGALTLYEGAARRDSNLAAAHYNLGKVRARRAATLSADLVPIELDRAHESITRATALDPPLADRKDPPDEDFQLSRWLLSPPLPGSEVAALADPGIRAEDVRSQLTSKILGDLAHALAPFYPAVLALLLVGLGGLRKAVRASKECNKCGRPVCLRCDPETGAGSEMCQQCVNVFARKGVVAAPLKIRKQIEVSHYQSRQDRLSYLFGLLCSGAGHIFTGLPLRGAVYAFLFLFAIVMFFFRAGVMRSPYGDLPLAIRLVPLAVIFFSVYLLSLRGLYKRQNLE